MSSCPVQLCFDVGDASAASSGRSHTTMRHPSSLWCGPLGRPVQKRFTDSTSSDHSLFDVGHTTPSQRIVHSLSNDVQSVSKIFETGFLQHAFCTVSPRENPLCFRSVSGIVFERKVTFSSSCAPETPNADKTNVGAILRFGAF